jgi:D-amino peptidase
MKIYMSSDIEGTAGITHWDEARKGKDLYAEHVKLMTDEVVAACSGAIRAGATEITLKDAHGTGRNITTSALPDMVRIIRGWSGHPYAMIQDIDESYDALIMTGYHSGAGTGGHPLAHTMTGFAKQIRINGDVTSEFMLNRWATATYQVPTVFVSGDQALCDTVKALDSQIETVATMEGIGESTNSMMPGPACQKMLEGVEKALSHITSIKPATLPDHFDVEIVCATYEGSFSGSFYPGMSLKEPHVLSFQSNDIFEVMRMLKFILK